MIRRKLMLAFGLVVLTLPAGVGAVYAAPNPSPSGTGQPNQTCQIINGGDTGPFSPGQAQTSPGSVFNEATPGKGGFQYNLVGAPSQYDVACYQQSQKP